MIVKASSSVTPTLRFGVFELDPKAGELRKKGMKIRLQGQPVDILVMLLQRPGETVTREELQKNLWPADTFVDFEQGLNNAMKRLRAALDDDAESPHFIETLPRRGYRFIGQVERAEQANSSESQISVNGQRNRIAGRGWKTGIAVGSVILLIASGLLFSPIARHWLISLFTHQSHPQPLEAVPADRPPRSGDFAQFLTGW